MMTDAEILEAWVGFVDMCQKIADPEVWENTSRPWLVDQFADVMRGCGHRLTEDQIRTLSGAVS